MWLNAIKSRLSQDLTTFQGYWINHFKSLYIVTRHIIPDFYLFLVMFQLKPWLFLHPQQKKRSRVFLFFFSPIKKTRKSLLCFPPFHQSAWLLSEFAIIRLVTIKKLSRQNKQVSRRRLLRKTHDTNECLQDLHTRASKRISQGRHTRTILKQEPPPPPRRSTKACQAPLRVHFLKIFMEGKDPW